MNREISQKYFIARYISFATYTLTKKYREIHDPQPQQMVPKDL